LNIYLFGLCDFIYLFFMRLFWSHNPGCGLAGWLNLFFYFFLIEYFFFNFTLQQLNLFFQFHPSILAWLRIELCNFFINLLWGYSISRPGCGFDRLIVFIFTFFLIEYLFIWLRNFFKFAFHEVISISWSSFRVNRLTQINLIILYFFNWIFFFYFKHHQLNFFELLT
jgi:hypothetical protein